MSILNPEVIFPEIGELCGITSGKTFYPLFTNAGIFKQIFSITGLFNWSMSELNASVHTNYTNGLKKVIAEAPNGVQLALSAYVVNDPSTGTDYVDVAAVFIYNNVVTYKDHANTGVSYTLAVVKTYGIKGYLSIEYPQEPVVADYTKASSLLVRLFIPCVAGADVESWQHITDGTFKCEYVSGNMIDENLTETVYYPSHNFMRADRGVFVYTDLQTLVNELNALTPQDPVDIDDIIKVRGEDPSQDVDPSGPGGGGGSYVPGPGGGQGGYIPGDPVDVPPLPVGGSAETGSIKSFLVTPTIIKAVFNRLWNNNIFDVITWQKIIEEPLDAIVSLICVPVTPTASGSGNIQLGNIDTQVAAPVITNQYVQVNAGSVTVPEFWGSALDYSPYTKIQIFVPGVGIRPLKPEDVIRQPLSLVYNFDVLTGNFTAHLKCGQSVLYKFPGNMKATIPITSRIYSALEAVMKGAGSTVNSYATGAMIAASRPDATAQNVDAAATNAAAGTAVSAAINVAMSKTQIQRSGDISGSASLLDDFVPYLIIHRPVQSLANNFKKFKGYPANMTAVLSSLSGYTEIEYVHLENISGATDEELVMIERLLKSGVII